MANLRDIRRKIATVKNIAKITQAMKMVAAAKLRRAQDRVAAARPYAERMREMLERVVPRVPPAVIAEHPLLQPRETDSVALVVITSDRGLCGSYNNNIIRLAQSFVAEQREAGREVEILTIGRKGTRTLRTRGYTLSDSYDMLGVDAPFAEVQVITRAVVGAFTRADHPVGEVHIAYTKFINAVAQRPVIERFLPIEAPAVGEAETGGEVAFEFEPRVEELLAVLLPRFVDNQVYQYLLEATASEFGARMTAMSKASDNAAELIGTLTLEYNRARQDAITREILDIVGGAEALAEE